MKPKKIPLTLRVLRQAELAEIAGVKTRSIQRSKHKFVIVEVPIGKKGHVLKRYLPIEAGDLLIQYLNT